MVVVADGNEDGRDACSEADGVLDVEVLRGGVSSLCAVVLRATYRLDASDATGLVVWPAVKRLESDWRRWCDVSAELGEERLGVSAVSAEYALQDTENTHL